MSCGRGLIAGQIAVLRIALQQPLAFEVAADAPCQGLGKPGRLGAGRRLHPAEPQRAVGALDVHPVEEQHVEVDFRFSALPKRWISVTAPVWAVLRENPAFLIRCVAMQR